jgi:hypothetical protein
MEGLDLGKGKHERIGVGVELFEKPDFSGVVERHTVISDGSQKPQLSGSKLAEVGSSGGKISLLWGGVLFLELAQDGGAFAVIAAEEQPLSAPQGLCTGSRRIGVHDSPAAVRKDRGWAQKRSGLHLSKLTDFATLPGVFP